MIGGGRYHRKDERNREILELRRGGMTYRRIGEKYGITYQRARDIVIHEERMERQRAGTPRPVPPSRKFEWPRVVMNPDRDAEILKMWKAGSTYREIGEWFRISTSAAYEAVKRQLRKEREQAAACVPDPGDE